MTSLYSFPPEKKMFLSLYYNMAAPNMNGRLHLQMSTKILQLLLQCIGAAHINHWVAKMKYNLELINRFFLSKKHFCQVTEMFMTGFDPLPPSSGKRSYWSILGNICGKTILKLRKWGIPAFFSQFTWSIRM